MKTIVCHLAALSILGSSVAFAQPASQERNRQPAPSQQQQPQNNPSRNQGHAGPQTDSRPNNNNNNNNARPNQQQPGRPAAQAQNQNRPHAESRPAMDFRQGERIPQQYRGYSYRVDDWKAYGLSQPPRNHHWVQIGGDFILIAAATGVITSILLNK